MPGISRGAPPFCVARNIPLRIGNMNDLSRGGSPFLGSRERDVRCRSQIPTVPGADGMAAGGIGVAKAPSPAP